MKIHSKIREGLRNPKLVFYYLRRKKYTWVTDSGGFARKRYDSYEEYLKHQKKKLELIQNGTYGWFGDYDERYQEVLRGRLRETGQVKAGDRVLCLAARLGTEVKSFIDLGCFAVGLDLNPGKENEYVVCGDFHHLQYADNSVDVVFCNSLDHAYGLEELLAEIRRVLHPSGRVILEINTDAEDSDSVRAGYFESMAWDSEASLLKYLKGQGLVCVHSMPMEDPWQGVHATFSLDGDGATSANSPG